MMLLVTICLTICLGCIAFQDFNQRAISWFFIPISFSGFVYAASNNHAPELIMKGICFNISFILIQLVLLTIYISIKNKKWVTIVNTYIGLGDILFFIVIAAAFSPINFIVFYIVSTTLTLLGFVIVKAIKKTTTEIPLAGAMAMAMLLLLISNFYWPQLNFYNDDLFISYLNK